MTTTEHVVYIDLPLSLSLVAWSFLSISWLLSKTTTTNPSLQIYQL